MSDHPNPYLPPSTDQGDASASIHTKSRTLVGHYTLIGGFFGTGFGMVIQLVISWSPYSKQNGSPSFTRLDDRIEFLPFLFWSIVCGLMFAVLGSVTGALADTFTSSSDNSPLKADE